MDDFSKDIALIQSISAVTTILDVVCRTTGMGFAAIARVTEGRWVACSVLDHIQFGLKAGEELVVETTICHEIRTMRQPVIINNVDEDELYRNHHTPRLYGFQSYISIPIFLTDDRFFGTLCAIDPKPASLNRPEVVGMFKLFAELIAFHVDVAEKLAISESFLRAERKTSELREQFIGVLGHDLRSPLNALSVGVSALKEETMDEDGAFMLGMMERSVSRMSGLIDDVVDFTRGRLGGGIMLENKSDASVEPILQELITEMRAIWPGRMIATHFALFEKIVYDRKRIAQLFTNLLSNAMVHSKPETPVIVKASSIGGRFEFSVSNQADLIPADSLAQLFEPFSRGEPGNYQDGLGLGLYIASEIAKSHGGRLEVISTVEETRFTFVMPSAP